MKDFKGEIIKSTPFSRRFSSSESRRAACNSLAKWRKALISSRSICSGVGWRWCWPARSTTADVAAVVRKPPAEVAPSLWRLDRLRCDGRMVEVGSGSTIVGNRGMGNEDGATSKVGGPPIDNGEVTDDSPPKFKSTGDVRRTLLVLLLEKNWLDDSLCVITRLPLLERCDVDDDRHGKSRFKNLDRFPPPWFHSK